MSDRNPRAAQARPRRKLTKDQGRVSCRGGDLIRTAQHFLHNGLPIVGHKWSTAIADYLVFRHGGALDWYHVVDFAQRKCCLDFDETDDDSFDAFKAVHDTATKRGPLYRMFSDRAIANLLGVNLEIKLAAKARTIAAYDETRPEALERGKQTKLARDRKRRAMIRAAKCAQSRAEYLAAHNINKTRPWELVGMSRPTWYRKGKPTAPTTETSGSPTILPLERSDQPVSRARTSRIVENDFWKPFVGELGLPGYVVRVNMVPAANRLAA